MQNKKLFSLFGFILGWFSLIAQFVIMMQSSEVSVIDTIVRFFTFFTILSNILVSICFTAVLFNFSSFFKSYKTQTAIAVYISIVAIVYNIILRFIWEPTGLQRIVDELLHVVNPIIFVIYWFMSKNEISLSYKYIFKILIFPLVYLFTVLLIGSYTNYYPYPFLDVNAIGYTKVIINSIGISTVFAIVSLLFVFICNRRD
ncbi:MAG TPA: Pr6Pr family membrane protein [Flavobacterium sp.]|uniref:Pr6Pr family membrane protein n=1 Tax=unclassified Flavobacterium TaxID=196869 RepID=UPI0025C57608|nr:MULTISPECIES: Pr6Pr family membrane protein [unclassified Flavobacterium]HRE79058.1 Pr6Pr family membrane protein [Flavobacterium sp.]